MKVNPLGKREFFWMDFLYKYYHLLAEDGDSNNLENETHDEL